MAGRPDVLCIGDIATDAIIKLFDDQAMTFEDQRGEWLAMPFAAKIPYDTVRVIEAVGNASNAAVSFARLGLLATFVTNVGDDAHGRNMVAALTERGVDTRFVTVNPGKASNYHYVLCFRDDRTILTRHEEYDYRWPRLDPADAPQWAYFSSLSKHALSYQDDVADWLHANPGVKLAFQPGTLQINAGADRLARIYERTHVLVLNREEAVSVTGGPYEDVHDLLTRLHQLGPLVVVITDGPDSSYASDGTSCLQMPTFPDPAPPVDRTGAGDSFASTFVAALIMGQPLDEALRWAPINPMNVVQHIGAQAGLLSKDELRGLLLDAPEWYRPTPF